MFNLGPNSITKNILYLKNKILYVLPMPKMVSEILVGFVRF